jgi:hypothetical protein
MRVRVNFYKDKMFHLFLNNTELTDCQFIYLSISAREATNHNNPAIKRVNST